MIGGPDHGSLVPGVWSIRCDVKGCQSCLTPLDIDANTPDVIQRRDVRVLAEANGWYVAQDKSVVNQSWDLCPAHAPPHSMHARESTPPISVSIVGGSLVMKREKP